METIRLSIPGAAPVSGLFLRPEAARCTLVLGHGAGAGMRHSFMEALAAALAKQRIATLRYQFPYMEAGRNRPDRPEVAQSAILAALKKAEELAPDLPVLAGGKSFGGRMTSQLVAVRQDLAVRGVVFYGFPLHPAGKPGIARAEHLSAINVPLLFLQGTRDTLADEQLIAGVCRRLSQATLYFLIDGDHSFKTRKSVGVSQEDAIRQLAAWTEFWAREKAGV